MSKKQTKKLLRMGELVKMSGARASTIKYYSEIGFLPFEQGGAGLTRRYDEAKAIKRLREIKQLRGRGLSVDKIRERFK